ncbi:hypothetical protein DFA_10160 [Cavenderia fasciculata]|uniref:Uncharacterized protein n=1 Tax=Cavenderia fasciculata TaxID=261658 RepID=F4Q9F7_CACFS|nr:uncharacterized protein DFA_10160 [Cavenderia fasciculata]EGG15326.1 hypothetical protein DFA_10160 [Cavenderia fasciculata]|eukprot:XP_004352046.1 hypothetical protein DFA_10160 [Cavenderia fasciculata]
MVIVVTRLKNNNSINSSKRIRWESLELLNFIDFDSIRDEVIPWIMSLIGQAFRAGEMEYVSYAIQRLSNASSDWFTNHHARITIETFMPILKQPETSLELPVIGMTLKMLLSVSSDDLVEWDQQQQQPEQFVSLIYSNVSCKVKEIDLDIWNNDIDEKKKNHDSDDSDDSDLEDSDDSDEYSGYSKEVLDYSDEQTIKEFAQFLANPVLSNIILEECKRRVVSTFWKDRYVSLLLYTKMVPYLTEHYDQSESIGQEMEKIIKVFMSTAIDTNPRVGCAFFTFLSEVFRDGPHFSISLVNQLLPYTIEIFFFSNTIFIKIILISELYYSKIGHLALEAIREFAKRNGKRFSKQFKAFLEHFNEMKCGVEYGIFSDYIKICMEASETLGKDYSIYIAPTMKIILDILNQSVGRTREPIARLMVRALKGLRYFLDWTDSSIIPYLETLVNVCTRLSITQVADDQDIYDATDICYRAINNFYPLLCVSNDKYGNHSQQATTLYSRLLSCILDSWIGSWSDQDIDLFSKKLFVARNLTEMMADYFMTSEQITNAISKLWIIKNKVFGLLLVDDRDEDYEVDQDSNIELLANLYKLVGHFVKKTKEVAIRVIIVMDILSDTLQFINNRKVDNYIKQSILQMFSDICEFGGQPSIALYPQIIPVMIEYLSSDCDESAQNAAFGLGVAAANAKEQFAPYLFTTLRQLKDLVSRKEDKGKEMVEATVDAISAIGKLIRHVPQLSPLVRKVIPEWLEKLPINHHIKNTQCIENFYHIMQLYPNECLGEDDDNYHPIVDQIKSIISEFDTRLNPRLQKYGFFRLDFDELAIYQSNQQTSNNIQSLLSILIKDREREREKDNK